MKQRTAREAPSEYRRLEDVLGCKWSVSVLQAIAAGVQRPGALERHIAGISTKILSERLRKLEAYGLISKSVQATKPPRTDYALTRHGIKVVALIAQVIALDEEIHRTERTR
jgi:DNA-binding HxlR family transcriptional regulator